MEDDDDPWRLKIGRFSDAEERFYGRLFRWKPPKSSNLSSRALIWRTRHAEGGWRLNDGPQVVVKAAGSRKSKGGVRACVRYVARLRARDDDEVPVFDEFGRALERDQVLSVVKSWGLEGDGDNLSAEARRQPELALPERRRLRNVQAWHFVFAIVADDDVSVPLIKAAAATIDTMFTAAGHKVIWALHRDCPGRPHIHAVVKAKSEFGRRLRCDFHGDLFDTIRTEFAANLSRVGLQFQASRREDRAETRDQIMRGLVPLRPAWRSGRRDGNLARRAPNWLITFGRNQDRGQEVERKSSAMADWVSRWLDRIKPRAASSPPPIPPELNETTRRFQMVYREPRRAMASWQALAMEGAHRGADGAAEYPALGLALWYAKHLPDVFGETLPGTSGQMDSRDLRKLPLPPPEVVMHRRAVNMDVLHHMALTQWRRRVARDRSLVIASLIRLAGIAHRRLGAEALTQGLLRQAEAAMDVPIGQMPLPHSPVVPKSTADSGGAMTFPSIVPAVRPVPVLENGGQTVAKPPPRHEVVTRRRRDDLGR